MEQGNRPVLEVANLTKRFGGLVAVDALTFSLKEHEILGIIGPNGAGKTTVFNLVTGFITPTTGRVGFKGKNITGDKPDKIATMGIARTFQNIRPFKSMTVLENVMVSAQLHHKPNLAEVLLSLSSASRTEALAMDRSRQILSFLGLEEVAGVEAQSLTHGTQRRLEIARALALEPVVLLLDEPAAGLNPTETAELLNTIRTIRNLYGLSIILVEHDMALVMNLCERLIVLNYGEVIGEGTCDEVRSNKGVIEAYLGEETSS